MAGAGGVGFVSKLFVAEHPLTNLADTLKKLVISERVFSLYLPLIETSLAVTIFDCPTSG